MTKLLTVFAICLVFTYFSQRQSDFDYQSETYITKEHLFYGIAALAAILLCGLRTSYNDTATYIENYDLMEVPKNIFSKLDWSLGSYPGFELVNRVLKSIGLSAQTFIMFYAIITIAIYMWFIHKYSNNLLLSIFLFFAMESYVFAFAAIKQCVAIAFCLIAVDAAIERRYVKFIIWIIIAVIFHPFSILYIVTPVLAFTPWTQRTYLMLIGFGAAGLTIQKWFSAALGIASNMGASYGEIQLLGGEGVNPFRLAVLWATVLLSWFISGIWSSNERRDQNIIMNLTMVNAEIMFIALFGNPIYIGRLANYFLIFHTISLPWMLQFFEENSKKLMIILIVIGYLGYFYYANAISGGGFDAAYQGISFLKFLTKIFS